MKTTTTTTTTTTIKNNIFIFGLLLLLILFTATKAVTPTSQVIISDWIPHYDANGVDICDTDPLNEVCSCPCDSSLVTVTQTFKGGIKNHKDSIYLGFLKCMMLVVVVAGFCEGPRELPLSV